MMLFDGVICFLMCVYIPSLQPVPRDGGLQGGGPIFEVFVLYACNTYLFHVHEQEATPAWGGARREGGKKPRSRIHAHLVVV